MMTWRNAEDSRLPIGSKVPVLKKLQDIMTAPFVFVPNPSCIFDNGCHTRQPKIYAHVPKRCNWVDLTARPSATIVSVIKSEHDIKPFEVMPLSSYVVDFGNNKNVYCRKSLLKNWSSDYVRFVPIVDIAFYVAIGCKAGGNIINMGYVSFDGAHYFYYAMPMNFLLTRKARDVTYFNDAKVRPDASFYDAEIELCRNELYRIAVVNDVFHHCPNYVSKREVDLPSEATVPVYSKGVTELHPVKIQHNASNAAPRSGEKKREIGCECYTVRSHYRHYKSGKTVLVAEYRKGKKRHDPAALVSKTYVHV